MNFQLLEAYNVDIENFNYNVSDMVDNIFVGPQGELLESVNRFNEAYSANIGVTKSFTLKPGGYDEIKRAYNAYVLRYDMKPRGIKSIFDRITSYGWRLGHIKRDLLNIENKMKELKASGIRWQDNTDQFVDEVDKAKSNIISALSNVRELFPHIDISCKVIPVAKRNLNRRSHWNYGSVRFPHNDMFSIDPHDFMIVFYIKIKNLEMNVHVMDDDRSNEYKLPMDDLYIASGMPLLPFVSRHWGRTEPRTDNPPSERIFPNHLECIYSSPMRRSEHPYIGESHDRIAWDAEAALWSPNICTGNMGADIRKSLLNNELLAHVMHLINWVSNYYVPQTNPLNKIRKARNYGDDILFAQWRADLNNVSTSVFRTTQDPSYYPTECYFTGSLTHNMYCYTRNSELNSYQAHEPYDTTRYTSSSIEYPIRLKEYIRGIDIKEAPCVNCTFNAECDQYMGLQMLFSDNMTPEEEGWIGMAYELLLHKDGNFDHSSYFYVEQALSSLSSAHKLFEDYENMLIRHSILNTWCRYDGSTGNARWRRRHNTIMALDPLDLRSLYEEYIMKNKWQDFKWCADNICQHRALKRDEPKIIFNPLDLPEDNLGEPIQQEESITPEQRAIQWAIDNGGAQNL